MDHAPSLGRARSSRRADPRRARRGDRKRVLHGPEAEIHSKALVDVVQPGRGAAPTDIREGRTTRLMLSQSLGNRSALIPETPSRMERISRGFARTSRVSIAEKTLAVPQFKRCLPAAMLTPAGREKPAQKAAGCPPLERCPVRPREEEEVRRRAPSRGDCACSASAPPAGRYPGCRAAAGRVRGSRLVVRVAPDPCPRRGGTWLTRSRLPVRDRSGHEPGEQRQQDQELTHSTLPHPRSG